MVTHWFTLTMGAGNASETVPLLKNSRRYILSKRDPVLLFYASGYFPDSPL
jgi:hypothetical protein